MHLITWLLALTRDDDFNVSGVRSQKVTCPARPVPSVLWERVFQYEVTSDDSSTAGLFRPDYFWFRYSLSSALKLYRVTLCSYVRFWRSSSNVGLSLKKKR